MRAWLCSPDALSGGASVTSCPKRALSASMWRRTSSALGNSRAGAAQAAGSLRFRSMTSWSPSLTPCFRSDFRLSISCELNTCALVAARSALRAGGACRPRLARALVEATPHQRLLGRLRHRITLIFVDIPQLALQVRRARTVVQVHVEEAVGRGHAHAHACRRRGAARRGQQRRLGRIGSARALRRPLRARDGRAAGAARPHARSRDPYRLGENVVLAGLRQRCEICGGRAELRASAGPRARARQFGNSRGAGSSVVVR